jgi:hypothetical protein
VPARACVLQDGSWDEISGEDFLRKLLSMPIEEAKFNTVSTCLRSQQETVSLRVVRSSSSSSSDVYVHVQQQHGGSRCALYSFAHCALANSSCLQHTRKACAPRVYCEQ